MPGPIPAPYWYDMIYPIMAHGTLLELAQKIVPVGTAAYTALVMLPYHIGTIKPILPITIWYLKCWQRSLSMVWVLNLCQFTLMGTMIHLQC